MNQSCAAALVACLVLFTHFGLSLWSACTLSSAPQSNVHRYTHPLFEQPWYSFGCDFPTSTLNLECRFANDSQWSDWKDATSSMAFDASTPPERLEQYINSELRWQVTHNLYSENGQVQLARILESSAYAKALNYALRIAYEKGSSTPDSIQVRLAIGFIAPPDSSASGTSSYLRFPAHAVPK